MRPLPNLHPTLPADACGARRRVLAAALGLFGGAALAGGAPLDLAQLMQALARTRAGEATFVERREVQILDRTVESTGRLSFQAPDTFVRETLRPTNERLAVSGNQVTMSRGGRSRTMDLDAVPEAAVIVEAIRGTLTGNRAALEKLFVPTVSGSLDAWQLDLVPREARMRGQVASVRVSGRAEIVREVAVQLADGDRSVMTIEPVGDARRAGDNARPGARPASPAR
ncbi:LolA-related protein [Piscinibacter koreensis]|uniref:Outer membrane lipoprotein carrier protein LolA n=1 Tax=Piscinibacter koreensis TaxID=2742824 RepID=A0A7Y6NLL2_9BURK|nr:LolA-related protein [Schlegelella koreensis]NUZ05455.1 outer membrane lipoprotein carrier protein LolA [Schlegelella koreensis]